ncbi:hypothetical protein SETIT_4G114300v2 [Setaria italica]|uniref:Transposase Tnp1/En/Spm-like domain-containing protein n=1 Tax=Setaria italica TaxID=4555 RepID=A0A368QTJ6_SETIT|nr:hypothetical protein SETIT_4G114300v2 [Setaria italica]
MACEAEQRGNGRPGKVTWAAGESGQSGRGKCACLSVAARATSRRHPPKTIRLYLVSKQLPRYIFRVLFMKRTRRVKAPSLNWSESSRYPVYLLSLRNKGRIVAKVKNTLGVEGLETVDSRNKGDELIPRPNFEIRTLIDVIGYTIPWPRSHVKKDTSSNLKQPGDVTF